MDRFINWAVGSGARLRGYQSVGGLCDGGNLENATRSTTPQSNPICRFVLRNLTPCPMVYGGSIGSDRKVGFVGLQGDMGRSSLVTRARQSRNLGWAGTRATATPYPIFRFLTFLLTLLV